MAKRQAEAPPSVPPVPRFEITYGRDLKAHAKRFTLADLRELVRAADERGMADESKVMIMTASSGSNPFGGLFSRDAIYIQAPGVDVKTNG